MFSLFQLTPDSRYILFTSPTVALEILAQRLPHSKIVHSSIRTAAVGSCSLVTCSSAAMRGADSAAAPVRDD